MLAAAEASSFKEALEEGQRFFEGTGRVLLTTDRLNAELRSRNIDYVIIGAIGFRAYGYIRFTENLDVVLTTEGIHKFRNELLGRGPLGLAGYDLISQDAKSVRSFPEQAIVNFRIAGEFPGDGKPKPVNFPQPSENVIEIDGVKFPTLEKLVELKLASGMTAPDRLKDLADVQELIKIRKLSNYFAAKLHPYVRGKYLELLAAVEQGGGRIEEQS